MKEQFENKDQSFDLKKIFLSIVLTCLILPLTGEDLSQPGLSSQPGV